MRILKAPVKRVAVVGLGNPSDLIGPTPEREAKSMGAMLADELINRSDLLSELLLVSHNLQTAQTIANFRGKSNLPYGLERVVTKPLDLDMFYDQVLSLQPEVIIYCAGDSANTLRNRQAKETGVDPSTLTLPDRRSLYEHNGRRLSTFGTHLRGYQGTVFMMANPPDLMSLTLVLSSGMHFDQVYGINGVDRARLQSFLQERSTQLIGRKLTSDELESAFILGPHESELMVPVFDGTFNSSGRSGEEIYRAIGQTGLTSQEKARADIGFTESLWQVASHFVREHLDSDPDGFQAFYSLEGQVRAAITQSISQSGLSPSEQKKHQRIELARTMLDKIGMLISQNPGSAGYAGLSRCIHNTHLELEERKKNLFTTSTNDWSVRAQWRIDQVMELVRAFPYTAQEDAKLTSTGETVQHVVQGLEFLLGQWKDSRSLTFSALNRLSQFPCIGRHSNPAINSDPLVKLPTYSSMPYRYRVDEKGNKTIVPYLGIKFEDNAILSLIDNRNFIAVNNHPLVQGVLSQQGLIPSGKPVEQLLGAIDLPQLSAGETGLAVGGRHALAEPLENILSRIQVMLVAKSCQDGKNLIGLTHSEGAAGNSWLVSQTRTLPGSIQWIDQDSGYVFIGASSVKPLGTGTLRKQQGARTEHRVLRFNAAGINGPLDAMACYELEGSEPLLARSTPRFLYFLVADPSTRRIGVLRAHHGSIQLEQVKTEFETENLCAAQGGYRGREQFLYLGRVNGSRAISDPIQGSDEQIITVKGPYMDSMAAVLKSGQPYRVVHWTSPNSLNPNGGALIWDCDSRKTLKELMVKGPCGLDRETDTFYHCPDLSTINAVSLADMSQTAYKASCEIIGDTLFFANPLFFFQTPSGFGVLDVRNGQTHDLRVGSIVPSLPQYSKWVSLNG